MTPCPNVSPPHHLAGHGRPGSEIHTQTLSREDSIQVHPASQFQELDFGSDGFFHVSTGSPCLVYILGAKKGLGTTKEWIPRYALMYVRVHAHHPEKTLAATLFLGRTPAELSDLRSLLTRQVLPLAAYLFPPDISAEIMEVERDSNGSSAMLTCTSMSGILLEELKPSALEEVDIELLPRPRFRRGSVESFTRKLSINSSHSKPMSSQSVNVAHPQLHHFDEIHALPYHTSSNSKSIRSSVLPVFPGLRFASLQDAQIFAFVLGSPMASVSFPFSPQSWWQGRTHEKRRSGDSGYAPTSCISQRKPSLDTMYSRESHPFSYYNAHFGGPCDMEVRSLAQDLIHLKDTVGRAQNCRRPSVSSSDGAGDGIPQRSSSLSSQSIPHHSPLVRFR
jgi:hypothetical protein